MRVVVLVACAAAIRWWWCWLVGIQETSPLGTCLFILQVQPAPQCRQYTRHVPVFFFDTRTSPQPTNRSKRSDSAVRLRERKNKKKNNNTKSTTCVQQCCRQTVPYSIVRVVHVPATTYERVCCLSSVFSQSSRSVARSERPKERRERESERKTAQSVSQSVSQAVRQSPAKREEKKRTPLPVPAYACMVAPSTGTEEDPQSMPTFGGSHLCRFRAGPGRGQIPGRGVRGHSSNVGAPVRWHGVPICPDGPIDGAGRTVFSLAIFGSTVGRRTAFSYL